MRLRGTIVGGIIGFIAGFFSIFGGPTSSDTLSGMIITFSYTIFLGNFYDKIPFFSIFTIGYWNYGFVIVATLLGILYGWFLSWLYRLHRLAFYGLIIGAIVAEIVLLSSLIISFLAVVWYYVFLGFLLQTKDGVILNLMLYIVVGVVGALYGCIVGFIFEIIQKKVKNEHQQ